MHELSFAAEIVESIEREARRYPGCTVTRVRLGLGEMLSIEPPSLAFCLEAVAVGTVMERAQIEFDEVPLELDCAQCGRVHVRSLFENACPQCGRAGAIVSGTEITIKEIEIHEPDDQA